jgi:hypothetical protein
MTPYGRVAQISANPSAKLARGRWLPVPCSGSLSHMFGVEDIEAWLGQQVVDPAGEQLGKLDEIFFDSRSGDPVLISVKSGLLGRHSSLVPIDGAVFSRDYIRVAHRKEVVAETEPSAFDGHPDRDLLAKLGTSYGVNFSDQLDLQTATDIRTRRAEAEAARQRAEELSGAAQEKIGRSDEAHERAKVVHAEAEQAERDAEKARRAAIEARREAEQYKHD